MSNSPPKQSGRTNWFAVAMVLAAVIVLGAGGAYTMQATDTAAFCSSCHSMSEEAWTYQNSGHVKVTCNDCHAPNNLAAKIPFKAAAGASDAWSTVTKNIPDVIHANKLHKDVIQANCLRCHGATVSTVAMDSKPYCVDCHRSVPHKSRTPISTRKVADG
ncbi:MAG: cytochrome c3 family protein [Acidobacteriota bacterium]